MGIFFTSGEQKKRPGVYQRYENAGPPQVAGALNGICAVPIRSDWGPLGKVMTLSSYDGALCEYGTGGRNGTVNLIKELFDGGAATVFAVRMGSGGTVGGAVTLVDDVTVPPALPDPEEPTVPGETDPDHPGGTTEEPGGEDQTDPGTEPETQAADAPIEYVKVQLKNAGSRKLCCMIREALGDSTVKEFLVLEGTNVLEKIRFSADGVDEGGNLVEAGRNSRYCTFAKAEDTAGKVLALVPETAFPAGTDPVITNADYSAAFNLLEPYTWNAIAVDTDSPAIHSLLAAYMDRIYQSGKMCFAVVGEPTSVAFETRLAHARAFNSYKMIYVGGGWLDSLGERIEGPRAAARVAGMVASFPANQGITRNVISGAADTIEKLSNYQYEQTIDSGMLTFSVSSGGSVWIESGITTLVTLTGEDDEGWKKIKRTKIRFELMNRISETVEPLIGRVNNSADGRATVLQAVQGVLNTIAAEEKILPNAAVMLDPDNPPVGDSAWFIISADDIDGLEKMYFVYRFRYAAVDE